MSDVSSIRAEIKAWERSFKESNGKEPTIEDIKKLPAIAQKYKLYKKLSKAANGMLPASTTSTSSMQISKQPSTPVRPKSTSKSSALLQSPSRAVEATAPLESFNPFSPRKNKGKHKEVLSLNVSKSTSNSLLSPRKSDSQPQSSSDVVPPTEQSESSHPVERQLPEVPLLAISRARKRLRGEPVSPSPAKEKRRRVLSPNDLPFPRLQLKEDSTDNSDNEDEQEDDIGGSSFVDDSPMKPTANGRSFTFLFEDNVKSTSITDLFGERYAEPTRTDMHPQYNPRSVKEDGIFGGSTRKIKRSAGKQKSGGGLLKLNPATRTGSQSKLVQTTLSACDNRSRGPNDAPLERASIKRTLSEIDASGDEETQDAKKPDPPTSTHELLPPSPDTHASRRQTGKAKPQTRHVPRRQPKKKVKLRAGNGHGFGSKSDEDDGDNDEDSSSDSFELAQNVELIPSSRSKHTMLPIEGEDHSEIEDDLILNYARRGQPRGQGFVSPGKHAGAGHAFTEDKGLNEDEAHQKNLNHDLPQQLQRVLVAESLKSRKYDYQEEKIVKYLLSGRRIVHYDPRKGGEIWGVGEDDRDELVEDEDPTFDEGEEWEGDPVPWEVGELSESHYHPEEL